MKNSRCLLLVLFMGLNSISFAAENPAVARVIEESNARFDYLNHVYNISHILRVATGRLVSTSESLPRDTQEAHELFEEVCATRSSNEGLNKKVTITYNRFLTTEEFQCDILNETTNQVETIQFVATIDRDDVLKDLQVNHLSADAKVETGDGRKLDVREGAEIAIAVAASTLVAGILAKQVYAGENDKFLHATAGSLIGAGATLISYYGFNVSKNKAAIIGFATAVAVALLKEYAYDARNRDSHTVDARDAVATAMGGGLGAFFIRLNFKF